MNKDYLDLIEHTKEYRDSCKELCETQDAEMKANIIWKEKEMKVSKEYWEALQNDDLKIGKYNAIIKHMTFQEKLDSETAKMCRKLSETRNNSLREKLYTTKKQISIN